MGSEPQNMNRPEKGVLTAKLPHFLYGADYNPEQWPEEVWLEDAKLMQAAGVNIVSLGIFAWAKLEPRPGQYEFGWLDRVMDLLDQHNIKVNLATATASPPPWMARLYPESLPVTQSGQTLWPGGRQQYCPSSPIYRQFAAKLVRQLAERYAQHPALAMWHIGNEYACHVAECYCDVSAAAFRSWLQNRYSTLDALNFAWGTAFWSQEYHEWDEIYPPRRAPTFSNPTQQLDWKRFSSDTLLECFDLEAAVLRELTPAVPLTTNFMGFLKGLDYWKWAEHQDILSHDCYPDPSDFASIVGAAATYDLMRSLGQGRPWLLMEQVTSQVNWRPQNVLKRPGQMRLLSYQAVAHGANGTLFFQWRASRAGAEKYHGALVPHIGTENSRIWREVQQLGNELGQLDEMLDSQVQAEVAILFDWESWWALELDSKPSNQIKMMTQMQSYYDVLHQHNIAVDFVRPGTDFSQYKIVLVPNLYLVRDQDNVGSQLDEFVERGGQVVMSFFSGIVDQNEHIRLGGYPAPFRKLLGLWVEEFEPFVAGQVGKLKLADNSTRNCSLWSDIIHLEGAQVLASFEGGFADGQPAITRNGSGKGIIYYLGTQPDKAYLDELLIQVCTETGVEVRADVPEQVEVVRRQAAGHSYDIWLNHNPHNVSVKPSQPGHDLLSGQAVAEQLDLPPYGVAIISQSL